MLCLTEWRMPNLAGCDGCGFFEEEPAEACFFEGIIDLWRVSLLKQHAAPLELISTQPSSSRASLPTISRRVQEEGEPLMSCGSRERGRRGRMAGRR